MNVIDTSAMSRAEWLELRRQSIGASDAPVIAGLSKYKSRLALYLEKLGLSEPEDAGEEAWWGTELEGLIEDRLYKHHSVSREESQLMIRCKDRPWQTATLDMRDTDGFVWEFKAAGFQTAKNLVNGDASTLPDAWVLQAHHQMMCADTDGINFAVFIGHRLQLYRFDVEWDAAIAEGLLQIETEFRHHIETGIPPAEFDPEDAALLLRYYKGQDEVQIDLDVVEYGEAVCGFKDCVSEIKYAEAMRDRHKAKILAAMGDATTARCGPYTLRRKLVNVKERTQTIKASSYIRFTFTDGEDE